MYAHVLGSPVPGADVSEYPLRPGNYDEFDTRLMLHAANAVSHGYKRILIIAKDTGIIVQGISFFSDIGADKMWVPFGIGKKMRNISIHDIYSTMSSAKAKTLPACHALSFCIESSIVTIVMCIKRHDRQSITAVLRRLHWLPVKWRINYKIVVLVFRALHGMAPAYLSTLITPYEPRRALRSTDSALLCVPRHKLERYGRRSFSCAGPVLWNSLPEDMRLA